MNDYINLRIDVSPCDSDTTDLLAAYLAEEGYESFVADENGLNAYIPSAGYDVDAVKRILEDFPIPVETRYDAALEEGKDWNEEWEKNYFKPIVIGNKCLIHSSFHHDLPEAEYDIVIDPKMAFGTGYHATTSMMINHLLDRDLKGLTVTDMGTGTGILSILAMMRGASEANGIEIDPAACINARENVALNNERGSYKGKINVSIHEGDADVLDSLPPADIFLANINRNVILADIDRYAKAMKPKGELILSGFYKDDIPMIDEAAMQYGLCLADIVTADDDWASVVYKT